MATLACEAAAQQAGPVGGSVNAQDFGADPTGRIDLCAHGWKDAIHALSRSGGEIIFPAGTFTASCQLQSANRSIRVIGAGVGATTIMFVGKVGGIAIDQHSADEPAEIASMSIRAVNPDAGVAVSVGYSHFSSAQHGPYLHDLDIRGANAGGFWSQGIGLSNAAYAAIRDVTVAGKPATTSTGPERGKTTWECFKLSRTSIGVALDHNLCLYAGIGIDIGGDSEGAKINSNEFVAVNTGLYAQGQAGSAPPSIIFTENHVNSYQFGARFVGWAQVQSHSNLLYKTTTSVLDWTGFSLEDAQNAKVTVGANLGNYSGDILYGFRGTAIGGRAEAFNIGRSATNNYIMGETAEAMDYFADENNGNGPNFIVNDFAPDLGSAWFKNINRHIVALNNLPALSRNQSSFPGSK